MQMQLWSFKQLSPFERDKLFRRNEVHAFRTCASLVALAAPSSELHAQRRVVSAGIGPRSLTESTERKV